MILNTAQKLFNAHDLRPLLDDLSQMVAAFLDGLLDTALVLLPAAALLRDLPFTAGDFGLAVSFLQLGDEVNGRRLQGFDDDAEGFIEWCGLCFLPIGRPGNARVG